LKDVQGGSFFGKKPLEYVLSVYTNSENAGAEMPAPLESVFAGQGRKCPVSGHCVTEGSQHGNLAPEDGLLYYRQKPKIL
jgi:hypothetical protein